MLKITIWKILETLTSKELLNEKTIKDNLNITILLAYLSQNHQTINIANYISKNISFNEPYLIYLYAFSIYPKDIPYKWIKKKHITNDFITLLASFNRNINDTLNMLKMIDKKKLKMIENELKSFEDNNIKLNYIEMEEYFENILNKG